MYLLHRCECPSGYDGIRCETNVDDCIGNTCKNNATCIDLVGSYECSCSRGFTGGQCETKIAFCTGKTSDGERDGPCQNGGVCMDHFTHYTCKCKAGFTGENCTMNINDCVDNMCQVWHIDIHIRKLYTSREGIEFFVSYLFLFRTEELV